MVKTKDIVFQTTRYKFYVLDTNSGFILMRHDKVHKKEHQILKARSMQLIIDRIMKIFKANLT